MITFIVIYILTVLLMYRYIHMAHSPGGIWNTLETDGQDMFMTLCPVINTLACIVGWIFVYPKRRFSKPRYNKFFNIK